MSLPGYDDWKTTDPDDREMTWDEIDNMVEDCVKQAKGHIERLLTSPDHYGAGREYYEALLEYLKIEMEGMK